MSNHQPRPDACANGKPGYDVNTGKAYHLRAPCSNPARPGHIYCDRCRVESGGVTR